MIERRGRIAGCVGYVAAPKLVPKENGTTTTILRNKKLGTIESSNSPSIDIHDGSTVLLEI